MTYWIWWRTARVVPEMGTYLVTPWVCDGLAFQTAENAWDEVFRRVYWDARFHAAEAVVLPAGQRPDQGWVDEPGQVIDPADWWRETGGEGG